MRKTYNWAILGLGKIAHKFAQDLLLTEQGNLYAVASRSQEKANDFAQKYKSDKAFGSYQEMMLDKNMKKNARKMITSRFEQKVVWEALLNEYKIFH